MANIVIKTNTESRKTIVETTGKKVSKAYKKLQKSYQTEDFFSEKAFASNVALLLLANRPNEIEITTSSEIIGDDYFVVVTLSGDKSDLRSLIRTVGDNIQVVLGDDCDEDEDESSGGESENDSEYNCDDEYEDYDDDSH